MSACIASLSKGIQSQPDISRACVLKTIASAIRGTPFTWLEHGASSNAIGEPGIWSTPKKYRNQETRANQTV